MFDNEEELEKVYDMIVQPIEKPEPENLITDPDMLEDYNPDN